MGNIVWTEQQEKPFGNDYFIAYPLLCYTSTSPDNRELIIVNLAQLANKPYRLRLGDDL